MNEDRKKLCERCFKENGECLIELGACPLYDYGEDISTATYKEIQAQNIE